MAISSHNTHSSRFTVARNAAGRWEVTDHEKNEVEELISDEEIWLADRLEVIEDTAARNHREVMRLKKVLRNLGIVDETLELERLIGEAVAAEREACARVASGLADGADCDDRGMQDPETGEVPCAAEARGEVCVCVERSDLAHKIATKIRARGA